MTIKEEVIDELLSSREIKTQDDLFSKDGMLTRIFHKSSITRQNNSTNTALKVDFTPVT